MSRKTSLSLFDPSLVRDALRDAVCKLAPSAQWRNPVMFVVYLGASPSPARAWAHSRLVKMAPR